MLKSLQRFSALERPAQRLFVRAAIVLPLVSASLRLRGFETTRSILEKTLSPPAPGWESTVIEKSVLTARMVNAADRHGLVHPSCLAKSLTLWWLLGRQGISSHLRIGIRKEHGKFEAHAWVEREGVALNEPEEPHQHYAAFDSALASWPGEEG
jgi:Transglutaminase-like superfamily